MKNLKNVSQWPRAALLTLGLLGMAFSGCQSTVGGQTMPSATYLRDDVQYFIAGEETPLPRLRRALQEYKLNPQAAADGLNAGAVAPPPPGVAP